MGLLISSLHPSFHSFIIRHHSADGPHTPNRVIVYLASSAPSVSAAAARPSSLVSPPHPPPHRQGRPPTPLAHLTDSADAPPPTDSKSNDRTHVLRLRCSQEPYDSNTSRRKSCHSNGSGGDGGKRKSRAGRDCTPHIHGLAPIPQGPFQSHHTCQRKVEREKSARARVCVCVYVYVCVCVCERC